MDADKFDKNTQDIRHEFEWVPEKHFCGERAKILKKFSEAIPTYKTPELEKIWGEKARANLLRSSALLARRALE